MRYNGNLWHGIVLAVLLTAAVISGAGLVKEQVDAMTQRRLEKSLNEMTERPVQGEVAQEKPTEQNEGQLRMKRAVGAFTAGTRQKSAYVSPVDFTALLQQNPDTVGWIRVPDTNIDYPIVQSPDNQYYLHKSFDRKDSVYGTIYLDADSKADFLGWNNPVYGHHMKDGSMFRDVVKFKDPAFFEAHRYFEIYTPERVIHLKTLACYYSDSNGIVRKTAFQSQASFDKWVRERLEPCAFAEIPEASLDSMFVLVTCSYEQNDARTLLFAAEVDENGEFLQATGRNVPQSQAKSAAITVSYGIFSSENAYPCTVTNFEVLPASFSGSDCNMTASVV